MFLPRFLKIHRCFSFPFLSYFTLPFFFLYIFYQSCLLFFKYFLNNKHQMYIFEVIGTSEPSDSKNIYIFISESIEVRIIERTEEEEGKEDRVEKYITPFKNKPENCLSRTFQMGRARQHRQLVNSTPTSNLLGTSFNNKISI